MRLEENIDRIKELFQVIKEDKSNGWGDSKDKLEKTYKFKDFQQAMNFVNKVAKVAEKQNHHPDITITFNKVKLSITDHEKGGVSEKCHKFTNAIDKIHN